MCFLWPQLEFRPRTFRSCISCYCKWAIEGLEWENSNSHGPAGAFSNIIKQCVSQTGCKDWELGVLWSVPDRGGYGKKSSVSHQGDLMRVAAEHPIYIYKKPGSSMNLKGGIISGSLLYLHSGPIMRCSWRLFLFLKAIQGSIGRIRVEWILILQWLQIQKLSNSIEEPSCIPPCRASLLSGYPHGFMFSAERVGRTCNQEGVCRTSRCILGMDIPKMGGFVDGHFYHCHFMFRVLQLTWICFKMQ